jgi:hypothetical protein
MIQSSQVRAPRFSPSQMEEHLSSHSQVKRPRASNSVLWGKRFFTRQGESAQLSASESLAWMLLVATLLAAGIYPDGHWTRATKLTPANFEGFVESQVDAGKTLFVRWIASEG